MKKRNKIISIVMLSLLVIGVVSAVLAPYFGSKLTTLDVSLPILVTGIEPETITGGYGCEQVTGKPITIENKANQETDIEIISEILDDGVGVTTSYIGTLVLTKKDIVSWIPIGPSIEITYTIVGNTFEYDVISGEIPDGYELVYAMDNANRFSEYATVKRLSEITEDLPMAGDWNAGEDANYCNYVNTYDDYEQCKGAKLWIVKSDNIGNEGVLSWVNMVDYYYETNLIQYNSLGEITMSPNSTLVIKPVFDLDCMLVGTVVINTTIDNV